MPERIQRKRTKGWRMSEGTKCVTRPSRWGNPYPAEIFGLERSLRLFRDSATGFWVPDVTLSDELHAEAYRRHCEWRRRFDGMHPAEAARLELRGFNLACFCPLPPAGEPDRCHAQLLLTLANA